MKAVGLLFDFYLLLFCIFVPIAIYPPADAPALLMFITMLLFTPVTMELFPVADELLLFAPTAEPAPNLFGCLREFKMCCVFIALE